jgi:hypothetical protein
VYRLDFVCCLRSEHGYPAASLQRLSLRIPRATVATAAAAVVVIVVPVVVIVVVTFLFVIVWCY